jgi:formate dehydrogenase major subunit
MPRLVIDDRPVDVPDGTTLLHAARRAGRDIPTLCHDERLTPSGACRMCLVSVEGRARPVTACNTPAAEGMVVRTTTPELEANRAALRDLLDASLAPKAGAALPAREPAAGAPRAPFVDDTHPYFLVDMAKCIACFRCVRICDEVQGQHVWRTWNRGADVAIRPDGPSMLESSCVACGACVDTCPTDALIDRTAVERPAPSHWVRTTCSYCGVGCELEFGVDRDHIVAARPVLDAPVSKGHLCVKGRYAFDFIDASDRLTVPLVRDSRDEPFREATWEEAVRVVADGFRAALARGGPAGVGVLGSARGTNEENYAAQKFARVALGTNNVDCCARVCHAPTATAMARVLGTGAATNSYDDIERASAFLVCGTNTLENHPVVGARIRAQVRRGAPLIVIDPRRIELAEEATVHLALRPGTNIPLLNAMAHVLLTEDLVDHEFLANRVDGLAEFRASLAPFSPEAVAPITGVAAADIRRAARLYAAQRPAMMFHGLGVTEHRQGVDGVIALVHLALLTGNLGKPGAGVNPLRGQNNVQGSAHMGCEPSRLTGYVPIADGRDRFESVWKRPVPGAPGLTLLGMMDAAEAGRFHALYAIGYDILMTNADLARTRRALANVDFVVVQDLFLTETAREFANVVLPAASTFEKDGTFMNAERRIQRVRKAVRPRGASKPDWEILALMARELGFERDFAFGSAEAIWDEVRAVWPPGAGISYERIDRAGLQWPCPTTDHPGTTLLHVDRFPMGPKARLVPLPYTATEEICDGDYPWLLSTGRTLYQFNAGTMTGRTPNQELRPADTLDMAPVDADRLGIADGDPVEVKSRRGAVVLPARRDGRVSQGQLFATFHATEPLVNLLTSSVRDPNTGTPEYKVTAVAVRRVPS